MQYKCCHSWDIKLFITNNNQLAQASKDILKVDHLITLTDKGYHTGKQIQQCIANSITTHISQVETLSQKELVFPASNFMYDS
jgi:hypothetical protein